MDATTALAGTTVAGVALNRGYANTLLAEAKGLETGLSQGTIVLRDYVTAGDTKPYHFGGTLILSLGQSVGLDTVHDANDTIMTIRGYFSGR